MNTLHSFARKMFSVCVQMPVVCQPLWKQDKDTDVTHWVTQIKRLVLWGAGPDGLNSCTASQGHSGSEGGLLAWGGIVSTVWAILAFFVCLHKCAYLHVWVPCMPELIEGRSEQFPPLIRQCFHFLLFFFFNFVFIYYI